MKAKNLLEFNDVTMAFGGNRRNPDGVVALEALDLVIRADKPSIIAIAGESGSGKTTLARLGLGMVKPTGGRVIYKGRDLWAMSKDERRDYRREVQAIFQDPFAVFNPFYTIDRLLQTPIRTFKLTKNRAQARLMIADALQKVGLRPDEVLGRYPHQLSGGQRQRIVVARSLLLQPKLIVADEPVSMIDASLRANILTKLKELRDEFGISLLYITHDLATAHQISDQIFILYRGRVVEVGDATSVIRHPQHPYTQLLVSSIPRPDPDRRWQGTVEIPLVELSPGGDRGGCLFRHRCPHAMPECNHTTPEQFPGGLWAVGGLLPVQGKRQPCLARTASAGKLPSGLLSRLSHRPPVCGGEFCMRARPGPASTPPPAPLRSVCLNALGASCTIAPHC